MYILIGGAWPYCNGSLHIGHLAALLPGDILARYHRQKGDTVSYVSGSDCHGTPVTIRAKQENKSPEEISDYYHQEFDSCFKSLGFSYDNYDKTSSEEHKKFVMLFHKHMYEGNYVYEKETEQAYCEHDKQYLPDRFVVGECPVCNKNARGDQCEACGKVLEPEQLINPKCSICGNPPSFKKTTHIYLAIKKLKDMLESFINKHSHGDDAWRKNAVEMSARYINDGLQDRAITRDLDWGISVPKDGYESKKIYIWAENILGYLSASYTHSKKSGIDYDKLWDSEARHYYVHGKDNIPFHSIILPSLMFAHNFDKENAAMPDFQIISSEYLTLEGKKISTSANWAIWVKDLAKNYNPDAIRYFMIANGPEKRDTDFSWREFINSNNGELLGAYGNLVNRTFVFCHKYFDGKVPSPNVKVNLFEEELTELYSKAGKLIEYGEFKSSLDLIFMFVRSINKYFDTEKPWITVKEDLDKCKITIYNCLDVILNLAVLFNPFLPFSSKKILSWYGINNAYSWQYSNVSEDLYLKSPEILFERIDKSVVDKELSKLN